MGGGCPGRTKNDDEVEFHRSMYSFLAAVGKGGFGKVWKVQLKKTRQTFALKIMSKARVLTKRSVQSVMNQKCFLQSIDNKFIINMVASFQDRQNLYLVMDFLNGGDLRYYINRKTKFTEPQIKFLIRCIMEGLKYLHHSNIIHRDIKPENIVFEENGYCRITDLGVAREWRADNSCETSGTPGYMAPEVMCKSNHSFCADYFAVGVMCFELMMGYRPYQGSTRKAIRDQILAKQVQIPQSCISFSKELIDFTNKLIQRKAKNRLGYGGVDQILDHPWLKTTLNEQQQFKAKRFSPPFKPVSNRNYQKINLDDTEPSQVERENILLLKKENVQQMFKDYNFIKTPTSDIKGSANSTVADIKESKNRVHAEAFAKIQV